MREWVDRLMVRRAHHLVDRIRPHLPETGPVLDVGAGTGHTARRLRELRPGQPVFEVDVADLRLSGPRPLLFSAPHLPLADQSVAASLLLYVLQYSADPVSLLRDVMRVTHGPLVLVQSTYIGRLGWCVLRANELVWGPLAYGAGRASGLVRAGPFSLGARRLYNSGQLRHVIDAIGRRIGHWQRQPWRRVPVLSNLIVLDGRPTAGGRSRRAADRRTGGGPPSLSDDATHSLHHHPGP